MDNSRKATIAERVVCVMISPIVGIVAGISVTINCIVGAVTGDVSLMSMFDEGEVE